MIGTTMPSYICAMSEGDIDVLEDIFINKYREFIDFYWMIKDLSNDISKLTYDKKKKDCLSIKFTLDTLNPEDIASQLRQSSNDCVKVSRSKDKIQIVIHKN